MYLTPTSTCARDGCQQPVTSRKPNARFCSERCRKRDSANRYYAKHQEKEIARSAKGREARPLHATWYQLLQRCTNPTSSSFSRYGARGIGVCDRWSDPVTGFQAFVEDMGPRPEGTTLDRRDGSRGYDPSNCRWASPLVQSRNRPSVKISGEAVHDILTRLQAGDSQRTIAAHYGCSQSTISSIKRRYLADFGAGRLIFHY
jgi:endogenous inhibitor of DNA gyrase (YacG/DUF329 family)